LQLPNVFRSHFSFIHEINSAGCFLQLWTASVVSDGLSNSTKRDEVN